MQIFSRTKAKLERLPLLKRMNMLWLVLLPVFIVCVYLAPVVEAAGTTNHLLASHTTTVQHINTISRATSFALSPTPTTGITPTPTTGATSVPTATSAPANTGPASSNTTLVWILGIIAVVVIVGLLAYILGQRSPARRPPLDAS